MAFIKEREIEKPPLHIFEGKINFSLLHEQKEAFWSYITNAKKVKEINNGLFKTERVVIDGKEPTDENALRAAGKKFTCIGEISKWFFYLPAEIDFLITEYSPFSNIDIISTDTRANNFSAGFESGWRITKDNAILLLNTKIYEMPDSLQMMLRFCNTEKIFKNELINLKSKIWNGFINESAPG